MQKRKFNYTFLTSRDAAMRLNMSPDTINTLARNQVIRALVTHMVARLEFWRDMGILYIKQDGQWEEVTDVIE